LSKFQSKSIKTQYLNYYELQNSVWFKNFVQAWLESKALAHQLWHRLSSCCLDPGVNFINVFCAPISYESLSGSFSLYVLAKKQFRTKNTRVKCWWNWHLVCSSTPWNNIFSRPKNNKFSWWKKLFINAGIHVCDKLNQPSPNIRYKLVRIGLGKLNFKDAGWEQRVIHFKIVFSLE